MDGTSINDDFLYQIERELVEQAEANNTTDDAITSNTDNITTSNNTYTDPYDGTTYEWDPEKRGWFPLVDNLTLAQYTSNYGLNTSEDKETNNLVPIIGNESNLNVNSETDLADDYSKNKLKRSSEDKNESTHDDDGKKKKIKPEPCWFDVKSVANKHVYVSNLPSNINEEQFVEVMSKCGIIELNENDKPKVKLYKSPEGYLKGDGLCCYLNVESVEYSIQILDGYEYEGHNIKVEPAKFELKGVYDSKMKPKRKKNNKKKNKAEKFKSWKEPMFTRPKNERIVILKNLYSLEEITKNPLFIESIKELIKTECSKFGDVKKVTVYERHPEGIASVLFSNHVDSDKCVSLMHDRVLSGRVIEAVLWDGVIDYGGEETEEDKKKRLNEWENYLNS